jgi:hypothetical protein
MTRYDVTANIDDWYLPNTAGRVDGTTTLSVSYNNNISPSIYSVGFGDIDTSAIGTDVISAASLFIYIHSYTSTKFVTKTFRITMDDGTYHFIYEGTFTAAGWYEIPLTSDEFAYINKTGDTHMIIGVSSPGALKQRIMNVRAREYVTEGNYSMYMNITHAPAPTSTFIPQMMVF